MLDMAKKNPPSTDRHGPRRTISLRPDEYEQLQRLADRNNRPLLWQLRMILHEALREEGLWPPPSSGAVDAD